MADVVKAPVDGNDGGLRGSGFSAENWPPNSTIPEISARRPVARPTRGDSYTTRIETFLQANGLTVYRFEHRRRHRAVIVDLGGRSVAVFFPRTGGDRRGPLNAVRSLKRALIAAGWNPDPQPQNQIPPRPRAPRC